MGPDGQPLPAFAEFLCSVSLHEMQWSCCGEDGLHCTTLRSMFTVTEPDVLVAGAALPSCTTNSSIGDRAMPGNHVQQQKLHEGKDAPSNGPANSGTSYSIPVSQAMQQMPPVTKSNGAGETQAAVPPGTSRAQLASQEAEHVRRQGNEAFSKGQYAKSAELYGQVTPRLRIGPSDSFCCTYVLVSVPFVCCGLGLSVLVFRSL